MPGINQLLFLLIAYASYLTVCDRCCRISYYELPRYNLMKTNWRSNQPIVSRKVVSSVSECNKFAASKKALAFNFVSARNRAGRRENMCQALQCPEDHNMTTLVPEANYRYYSMYPTFVSPGEPLSCFDYRAWGEGEPSHSKGCVALVNPTARNSLPFWKVVPCSTSLPFICEVSPLLQRASRRHHRNRHSIT